MNYFIKEIFFFCLVRTLTRRTTNNLAIATYKNHFLFINDIFTTLKTFRHIIHLLLELLRGFEPRSTSVRKKASPAKFQQQLNWCPMLDLNQRPRLVRAVLNHSANRALAPIVGFEPTCTDKTRGQDLLALCPPLTY